MLYEFSEGHYDFSEGFARLRADQQGQAEHAPFIQQSHEFNMKLTGTNARDYYSNPEALVHGACRAALEMGFDLPDLCWDAYNIEAEALGAKVVMFDDLCPALDNLDPIVTSEKDLARLKSPDPARHGRMPFVFESQALYQELTGGTISQTAAIYGAIAVGFSVAQFLVAPLMGSLSDRFGSPCSRP